MNDVNNDVDGELVRTTGLLTTSVVKLLTPPEEIYAIGGDGASIDICIYCHAGKIIRQEGCKRCDSCGWSEC